MAKPKKQANDSMARGKGKEVKKAMTKNNVRGLAMMGGGKKKKKVAEK